MATVNKGDFSIDIGFVKLGAELSEEDRQCAWELYTEIATRVAVVGKRLDKTCKDFDGELFSESLDSLYNFFRECRSIMRKFPVGRIKDSHQIHLGVLINRILSKVLRPFLEKWSGRYHSWWSTANKIGSPYELQKQFPGCEEFMQDWAAVREIMREAEAQLAKQYELVPLD